MQAWLDLLGYDFIRNALYGGLLASVLCGVVGTFVVVKRLVFLSGGISHAAFGGLGVSYALGFDPRLGAAAASVLCALALGAYGREEDRPSDAIIGVLWAVGMAVGIVFIHQTPGYVPNLMTFLFGNILGIESRDLVLTLALVVVVLVLLVVFFNEIVAVAFDEVFAAVQGVRVRTVTTLLLVAIALAVVLLVQVVGILLVIALLSIPPLVSLRFARSFPAVLCLSIALGAVLTLTGLVLSYVYELPSGPCIVLLGALLLVIVEGWSRLRQRRVARSR